MRRVFVLLVHDPDTGMATAAVGALGMEDGRHYRSLLAYSGAEPWRERLASVSSPIAEAVEQWLAGGGVTLDLAEVAAPASPDLAGSVELVVDELLAAGGAG
jgi:hypothetical protein